jgi:hypothetical protein
VEALGKSDRLAHDWSGFFMCKGKSAVKSGKQEGGVVTPIFLLLQETGDYMEIHSLPQADP